MRGHAEATRLATGQVGEGRGDAGQHLAVVAPAPPAAQRVRMTRVSWSALGDLEITEWIHQGRRMSMIGRSAGWWIGDWLRFGNARYGEKYARAIRITGYDAQTLMNMVWVASRVEISRRRESLSWSHHAEVASLDLLPQERLLNHADAERLSVRDVRELVRGERRAKAAAESAPEPSGGSAVVCPECGHSFDAR